MKSKMGIAREQKLRRRKLLRLVDYIIAGKEIDREDKFSVLLINAKFVEYKKTNRTKYPFCFKKGDFKTIDKLHKKYANRIDSFKREQIAKVDRKKMPTVIIRKKQLPKGDTPVGTISS